MVMCVQHPWAELEAEDFHLYENRHAYVAFLYDKGETRNFIDAYKVGRVRPAPMGRKYRSRQEFLWWKFPAVPGAVIEARLSGSYSGDTREYYLVEAGGRLKPISRKEALRLAPPSSSKIAEMIEREMRAEEERIAEKERKKEEERLRKEEEKERKRLEREAKRTAECPFCGKALTPKSLVAHMKKCAPRYLEELDARTKKWQWECSQAMKLASDDCESAKAVQKAESFIAQLESAKNLISKARSAKELADAISDIGSIDNKGLGYSATNMQYALELPTRNDPSFMAELIAKIERGLREPIPALDTGTRTATRLVADVAGQEKKYREKWSNWLKDLRGIKDIINQRSEKAKKLSERIDTLVKEIIETYQPKKKKLETSGRLKEAMKVVARKAPKNPATASQVAYIESLAKGLWGEAPDALMQRVRTASKKAASKLIDLLKSWGAQPASRAQSGTTSQRIQTSTLQRQAQRRYQPSSSAPATPKQVAYAMSLCRRYGYRDLPDVLNFLHGATPEQFEAYFTKCDRKTISEIIDALKTELYW